MRPSVLEKGFTLLEVVVALSILSISLVVLLESQASSLNNAAKARDLTIATLLARSKMVDIEQKVFDEGFATGSSNEEGDFAEEGHPEVKWNYEVSEVKFDISALDTLCGESEEEEKAGGLQAQCSSLLGSVTGMMGGFVEEMARSVRACVLTVTWPEGKYAQSMQVRTLLTREDYNLAPAGLGQGSQGLNNVLPSQGSLGGLR
jgi:general secretion pathway protein I